MTSTRETKTAGGVTARGGAVAGEPWPAARHAVVVGGGITGLAAALALSRRGAQVTVLERDADFAGETPSAAFTEWKRTGAPQARHSHVFLGRLRNLLRSEYPEFLAGLLAAGAREMRATDRPPRPLEGLRSEPGDAELVMLGVRRLTFEWVLRRHVLETNRVRFLPGVTACGLEATPGVPPVVTGVRCREGAEERVLLADMVIDASGRRSAAVEWLAAIGAPAPHEELEQSGIVYYTRFYRLRPGASEPVPGEHPTAGDFHWVKFAVFPADDGTFSITLAVPLLEPRLKVLAKAAAFDEMVRAIPGIAPWIAPEVAEPIGDAERSVQAMGGLINRLRRFVTQQGPLAVGFFVLGDAAYCTNPLYGRGCAQGFLHAHLLADAVAASGGDLRAAAVALDQRARRAIEPFFRASVLADRDAVRRAEGRTPRHLRDRWRSKFLEDGVGVAVRCDPVVFRAMMRMMNMLETPDEAFGHPSVVARSLWALARSKRLKRRFGPPSPPERETTIARCEAAAGVAAG